MNITSPPYTEKQVKAYDQLMSIAYHYINDDWNYETLQDSINEMTQAVLQGDKGGCKTVDDNLSPLYDGIEKLHEIKHLLGWISKPIKHV